MNFVRPWRPIGLVAAVALLCLGGTRHVQGSQIVFDLTCVLNGLNPLPAVCAAGPSFGTVTLTDDDGSTSAVNITVDLFGPDQRFSDLVLNFDAFDSGITGIAGDLVLSENGFSISPYTGLFDLGGAGPQGFAGDSGASAVIQGVGGQNLTIANLSVLDSLGNVFVGLHIQNIGPGNCSGQSDGSTDCIPGITGEGSLKIGGVLQQPGDDPVPEPSTVALFGIGLAVVAWMRRRIS